MGYLPTTIVNKVQKLVEEGTKPIRTELNKSNIHILDFEYHTLQISDPELSLEEYKLIISTIYESNTFTKSSSLKYAVSKLRSKGTNSNLVYIIEDPAFGVFLASKTYRYIQSRLSSVLKKIETVSKLTHTDAKGRIQANIGHIYDPNFSQTKSPLSELLVTILKSIPFNASAPILEELGRLQDAHKFDTSYVFQRENYDTTKFLEIIGKATILCTLHSFQLNNALATQVEGTIQSRVKAYVKSSEFKQHIIESVGSKSIIQEIPEVILSSILGKAYKSPHPKHTPSSTKSSIPITSKVTTSKLPKVPLRTNQGQFYSLTSLQTLINSHLQNVISANMGDEGYPGGQRRILNYRTGRLAASAQVERLSQSREGTITAFYSYMKNPYQVFEPGFAQGKPATRDPKLLIGKSIREIAATKVGNKLRAVSI